jgi:hypothetical protein
MPEIYLYGGLMIVGYLLVGLSCLRVSLHRPNSGTPLAPLPSRTAMTRQTRPVKVDVIHLDVHVHRYTPDGALRHAILSRHPAQKVTIDASYAEETVSAAILTEDTPRACRVCLN